MPGRTDNEVKNFYHTRIEKKKVIREGHANVLTRESSIESTQESMLTSSPLGSTCDTSSHQMTHDSWYSELFQPSDADKDVPFPSLMEEGFFYDDLHYTELSCSGSSYVPKPLDDHSIISSEFVEPGFFWDESSTMSSYQNDQDRSNEVGGEIYDPLFDQCFDYGMDLFS